MNKHGQTLILFVVLIPVIIMLMAIVVDLGLIMGKKIELEEITKDIIVDTYNSNDEKVLDLFKKNDVDVSNLKIKREDEKFNIEIVQEIKSIFGGIVGIKKYNIKVDITGYMKDNKINFE